MESYHEGCYRSSNQVKRASFNTPKTLLYRLILSKMMHIPFEIASIMIKETELK